MAGWRDHVSHQITCESKSVRPRALDGDVDGLSDDDLEDGGRAEEERENNN